MKLGTEDKKKTAIAVVLVVLAVAFLIHQFSGGGTSSVNTSTAAPAKPAAKPARKRTLVAHSLDPTLRFDLLRTSEDVTYKGTGRNIFRSEAPLPEIPKTVQPVISTAPTGPAPPPPIDLKFYGFAGPKGGTKSIFLLKGEDIFLAKEGDIVDRRYKIVHVGPSSVEVQDVLTNHTQSLPLMAG